MIVGLLLVLQVVDRYSMKMSIRLYMREPNFNPLYPALVSNTGIPVLSAIIPGDEGIPPYNLENASLLSVALDISALQKQLAQGYSAFNSSKSL